MNNLWSKAVRYSLLFFGISLLYILPAGAQPLNKAGHRFFTTRQGLSNDHISGIVQDQRGFIWMATNEGLDRYDGSVFTAFYHRNSDKNSLPSNAVRGMVLLPGNRLALATNNGLCIFHTISTRCHTFHELGDPDHYSFNNDFTFVLYDRFHHLWAASRTTLYEFNDSLQLIRKWRNPLIKANPYSYAEIPFTYPDGSPGFLLNRKPYKYNLQTQNIEPDISLAKAIHDRRNVDFITGNRYGIWWIKVDKDSLFHLDNEKRLTRFIIPLPDTQNQRYSLLSTQHDSLLWCGNSLGFLIRFNMKQNRFLADSIHFDDAPSIGSWLFATAILWDQQENLWIATVNGLHQYYSRQHPLLQIFDTAFYFRQAPVKTADVNSILKMDGMYWVGTYGSGLFRIDPEKHVSEHFYFHFSYKETGRNWIWNIRHTTGDTLWIGTQDGLIWFNTKDHHYDMVHGHGLPAYVDTFAIMTQFVDSRELAWMGINNGHGLIQYNPATNQSHIYNRPVLPVPTVSCITEDKKGNLWMAFMNGGGLVKWNRKTDHFSVIHARANSVFKDDKIYTLYADKQGSIWFSAGAEGLGQYDLQKKVIKVYGRDQGISSQMITSIASDGSYLWIGTYNGLNRFDLHTKHFKCYTTADGFPGNYFIYVECNHGRIYTGGAMNMTIFKENTFNQNAYPPKVYLTGMSIRNKPVLLNSGRKLKLKYNQNYIRFDFTGINFINGKENHYAYKLDGANPEWVQAGTNRHAIYASLAPGVYTFHVKAVNNAGTWSNSESGYTFTIVPPFWKTAWFLVLVILVAGMIIYLLYRYRLQQVIRLQQVRDQIAADLHDDMGASLSNINILSTMALQKPDRDKPVLKKMLESIRDDAQQSSEAIDDIVWSVNPKNDSLDRILSRMRYYASELFEAKNIRYVINFPENVSHIRLSMIKRRSFFLIYKEAVNNIVKHSECTRALIEVTLDGNRIKMELADNGKGFNAGKEYERSGLKNMRQRAMDIHAQLHISSGCGKGSRLTLMLL